MGDCILVTVLVGALAIGQMATQAPQEPLSEQAEPTTTSVELVRDGAVASTNDIAPQCQV